MQLFSELRQIWKCNLGLYSKISKNTNTKIPALYLWMNWEDLSPNLSLADVLIERTSSMLDEIESRTVQNNEEGD